MAGVWLKQTQSTVARTKSTTLHAGVYTDSPWGKKLKGVTLVTHTQHPLDVRGHLWATLPRGWFGWG